MSISPTVSLIDLSKQLNFEIDEAIKRQLCFSETLVISCCHVEGSSSDLLSASSSWSIIDTEDEIEADDKDIKEPDLEDSKSKNEEVQEDDTIEYTHGDLLEDDFHFFFFNDIIKKPMHKDISVIMVNKQPEINPRRRTGVCLCRSDDLFEPKCKCWMTICTCGATTTRTCKCGAVDNICICDPNNEPSPVCTCGQEPVCLCHPDNKPRPRCTCDEGVPCLCHTGTGHYPLPFCTCGGSKPCLCHPTKGNTACNCGNGENCTCKKGDPIDKCICSKTEVCFCKSDNIMRRICTCAFPDACICHSEGSMKPVCTCNLQPNECACHSDLIIRPVCTCDNPGACICDFEMAGVKRVCVCGNSKVCLCNDDKVLDVCTCTEKPCLCHKGQIREECICEESPPSSDQEIKAICICQKNKPKRKKPKKSAQGFIKCHETDSRHNYFDFAYGIHDKFDRKPEKKPSKIEIKDLGNSLPKMGSCPIHDSKCRVKRARPFSLDCCTATGGLTISIETLGEDKDRFLVQVASNFSKNGAKVATKLVSIVDCNLHTLEENRKEHSNKSDIMKQRGHYISICTNGYYNKITQISGERKKVKRLYHDFDIAHDFILEGSNLILLRYIAVKRFKGQINTKTVLMSGTVCSCTYISHGVSQALVNGKPMFVMKVDRQIFEDSGFMHEAKAVMTLKGHLITQEWSDSNFMLHINPLLHVDPETDDIQDTTPLRERWRQDMQLLSSYLQFKSSQKAEFEQYLSECEPLQSVIRDYLQTLLVLRPTDALHFTRHYFGAALSALDLPHNEYFDPCARHVRYHYYED